MIVLHSIEHVGIRVSSLQQALEFYRILGFLPDPDENFVEHSSVGLVNEGGIRINLIHNAERRAGNHNVLVDTDHKYPGITHIAFVVDCIEDIEQQLEAAEIPLTEGPVMIGVRRTICFVRDPDGNVIEFDQLWDN